jgi:hypothetical protein
VLKAPFRFKSKGILHEPDSETTNQVQIVMIKLSAAQIPSAKGTGEKGGIIAARRRRLGICSTTTIYRSLYEFYII